jgi:hypothetical protein
MRSYSGVRRSAGSGKNESTDRSTSVMMPRSMAAPKTRAVTLFVIDRRSCVVSRVEIDDRRPVSRLQVKAPEVMLKGEPTTPRNDDTCTRPAIASDGQ